MTFDDLISDQKRSVPRGITSICSTHPGVLEAVLIKAREHDQPVLVESTCNQVNQFGGYMGMTPGDYVSYVKQTAGRLDLPQRRLILGGDHLGPHVWQGEPASRAMEKSCRLVRDYIEAGYTKIHLDTSMRCADDPEGPLAVETSALRTAELAQFAEATARKEGGDRKLCFVIGTEVPAAGGAQDEDEPVQVTKVEALDETIQAARSAFCRLGLESAWERVTAVVVQPGVEFGIWTVHPYDRMAAAELKTYIEGQALVFEAHSTDYQTRGALRSMVEDHFAILKVGPALTFAYRSAIFALAMIEDELFPVGERSRLIAVMDEVMLENPAHWQKYYQGSELEISLARKYSLSDRIRYYWPDRRVQQSIAVLLENLAQKPPPRALISQYLPQYEEAFASGKINNHPQDYIQSAIFSVLGDYEYATGG